MTKRITSTLAILALFLSTSCNGSLWGSYPQQGQFPQSLSYTETLAPLMITATALAGLQEQPVQYTPTETSVIFAGCN